MECPCPTLTLELLRVNAGVYTVSVVVAVTVCVPELPVIVTGYCPRGVEGPALTVSVLELVMGFGEKDPVTPLGNPETASATLPVNPFCGLIESDVFDDSPCPTFTETGALSVNVGATTDNVSVAVAVWLPEAPRTVIGYCPIAAELAAVNVIVDE